MMLKDVILQGGYVKCPICGNTFKWSYKLELLHSPEMERMNKAPTAIYSTPHKYISHIATADGNVRFFIGCEKCGVSIETEAMELINKENYEQNKE